MRRLIPLLGIVLALSTAPGVAAERTAVVRGTLVVGDGSKPAAAVEVTLIGARLDGSGRFFDETVDTDERGTFEFEDVPAPATNEFALEANYDGGLFVFDTFELAKGSTEITNIEVWPTTSDPSVIGVERNSLFVTQDEESTGVLESVTVVNSSERAYIGRGRALGEEASEHTLGFALPDAAIGERVDLVDSTLNRLYAEGADFGFAATVAIPPGETTVTFTYPAPGSAGSYDLSRRALYPIREVFVFVTEPLEIDGSLLTYEGIEEVSDLRYRKWSSREGFDAGDLIPIRAVAEGSSSSNLWLGLGIGLGVVVLVALLAAGRRRARPSAPGRSAPRPPQAEDLVAAIAALDLKHESGALDEDEWARRRTRLKDQLIEAKQREPAS